MEQDNFNLGISNIILDYRDDSKIKFEKCLSEIKDNVYLCNIKTTKPTYNCNLCGRPSKDELLKDSYSGLWMRPHHMRLPHKDYCKKCLDLDNKSRRKTREILKSTLVVDVIIMAGLFTWAVVTGRKLRAK